MAQRHVVVLSDLHLWQTTDSDDLWMRYRHRRFQPDTQLARLFSLLGERIPPGALELVLNGDIFDFDVPPIFAGQATSERSPRTEAPAIERLRAILADHASFVFAVAKLLLLKHRVVFVIGNHDIQLHFAGVRDVLRQHLLAACAQLDPRLDEHDQARLYDQIEIHSWFYRSSGGIHIEHGQQYDPYCSVSDPVWPFHVDGSLHNTVGTLVLEHVVGKLGYFNPNVERSYLLTTRQYLDHWLKYYWGSPRSLLRTFFFGSLRILFELLSENGICGRGPRAPELQAADEAAHASLFEHWDIRATLRILHMDRMLLWLALLVSAVLACLSPLAGLCLSLLVLGLYRALYPQRSHETAAVFMESQKTARRIACIYGARAVVFGHSHEPSAHVEGGVFYGNSGTWVPMHHDVACTMDVEPNRPVIWLRDAGGSLHGGLYRFHGGRLYPTPTSTGLQPEGADELDEQAGPTVPDTVSIALRSPPASQPTAAATLPRPRPSSTSGSVTEESAGSAGWDLL